MIVRKGFYLVDCLIALTLILFSVNSVLKMVRQNQKHLLAHRQQQKAHEILLGLHYMPFHYLDRTDTLHYDHRGQPSDSTGKYRVFVRKAVNGSLQIYTFELNFQSPNSVPQKLTASRHVWREP